MDGTRVLAIGLAVVAAAVGTPLEAGAAAQAASCRASALPGLTAAWSRHVAASRPAPVPARASAGEGRPDEVAAAAGALEEFARVAIAILGAGEPSEESDWEELQAAMSGAADAIVPCAAGAVGRDRAAWRLLAAGYSAAEVGDILTGRLTRAEIDHARRLLMAGHEPAAVADYLDAVMARRRTGGPAGDRRFRDLRNPGPPAFASLDASALTQAVALYSARYGLDAALVLAVVDAESGGDHRAVSPRGAVGLMQLMPSTARMLGVDPCDPHDNLRGGIAYLAGLVRQFGDAPTALIAYNAGPTHARRVRRGEAVLYGETRRYLARIAAQTGMPAYP
jgi:hypothetical protein